MTESPHVERRFLGFEYLSGTTVVAFRIFSVPYWCILAATAAFPLTWWVRRRRAGARSRAGACPQCGYDLRATPDKCPECGWTPNRTG